MPSTPRRAYLAAMLFFVLAWAVLASPWLSGRFTIPFDAKAHFQAQIQFLAAALHSGQSPAWAPHVFGGTPQIADPQSLIFSPAFLLASLTPTPSFQAFDAYVLLLLAFGGGAILLLFRDRGWHPAGGLLAALVFAFGASAAWRVQHIGQIQSFAMFAIALWALTRALDRRSARWGAAAGLAAGAMVVEPDQIALLGVYLLAGVAVAHLASGGGTFAGRVSSLLRPLVAGAIAGALVIAVPLVLTMLFAGASSRAEVSFAEAARGSLHPISLLTIVVGDLFGALSRTVDYWGPYSESWDPNELTLSQNMSQVYSGMLPALLILTFGLSAGWLWAREVRIYVVSLLAVVVFAMGAYTPLFHTAYAVLPGVSMFRRPADATFFVGAYLGIVGGYLLHRWLSEPAIELTRPHRVVAGVALAGVFVLAIGVALHENRWIEARLPLAAALGWLALATALLAMLRFTRHSGPVLAVALVAAFTTADLAGNNGPNESTAAAILPNDVLDPATRDPTVLALKALTRQPAGSPRRDRVEIAGLGFDWPNAGLVHGFDHVLGYNPLRLEVVTNAVGAGDTIAGWDQRRFTPLFPSYRSRLADLLGLRFVVTPVPVGDIDTRLKPDDLRLIARTQNAYIYENRGALPRVLFADRAVPADFEELIETGAWPNFDPRTTVLLEEVSVPAPGVERPLALPVMPRPSAVGTGSGETPGGRVVLVDYENTEIVIDVDTRQPGWVVLNDVWHPWWRATVNDVETRVLKANVMFRAVRVPAGRSSVVFTFTPLSGAMREIAAMRRGWWRGTSSSAMVAPAPARRDYPEADLAAAGSVQ